MTKDYERQIEAQIFKAYPYPEYRPSKSGRYLVSCPDFSCGEWLCVYYDKEHGNFDVLDKKVTAWAYMLIPYSGGGSV